MEEEVSATRLTGISVALPRLVSFVLQSAQLPRASAYQRGAIEESLQLGDKL